jgi:hypothetical protein
MSKKVKITFEYTSTCEMIVEVKDDVDNLDLWKTLSYRGLDWEKIDHDGELSGLVEVVDYDGDDSVEDYDPFDYVGEDWKGDGKTWEDYHEMD